MRLFLMGSVLALAGCGDGLRETARWEAVNQKVARGRAEQVDLRITMPAGELSVGAGASDLMEGAFRFTDEAGRPRVVYEEGIRGRLTIEPQRKDSMTGQAKWDVRFAERTPVEVNLNMGAGQADLQLGSLDLRGVSVNGGAGALNLDLRGKPSRDYSVNFNGGVGQVRIYVPGQAGVRARINGGLGGVETEGNWVKSGREYKTALYDDARPKIEMRVNGGIGTIKLIAVE